MTERGLAFMGPLVPLVLSGAKTVTRRTGRRPAEVGDLLWIREAWRTIGAWDDLPPRCCWWSVLPGGSAPAVHRTPVHYIADGHEVGGPFDGSPRLGRYRHARFLPLAFARPWRGRVVSVERVPAPPDGIDDAEAIREGACEERAGDHGCPTWTLDGVEFRRAPAAAFLAGWARLHPDAPSHCWRVEWVPA